MNYAACSIVFNKSQPMHERLRQAAGQWIDNGCNPTHLLSGEAFFAVQCWVYAECGRDPGYTSANPEIIEYISESRVALGGDQGWQSMLIEKVSCPYCDMRWSKENICYCVSCMNYVCLNCRDNHALICGNTIVG